MVMWWEVTLIRIFFTHQPTPRGVIHERFLSKSESEPSLIKIKTIPAQQHLTVFLNNKILIFLDLILYCMVNTFLDMLDPFYGTS